MMLTELTREALDAAAPALADKGPINMVNLLRYKPRTEYGAGSEFAACSGQEAYYTRYIAAFSQVEGADQTKVVWIGNVQATLVVPDGEAWHDIAIVEYPSFELLRSIVTNPQYEAQAAPHRRAALADWRFIVTTKADLPG